MIPSRCAAGVALALGLGPAAPAVADDDAVDALQLQVDALEAEIATFRAARGETLEHERSAAVRALVGDVLADAEQRAAFRQGATTAGYLDGFVLTSADGAFLLRINGLVQTRFVLNRIDAPPGVDGTRAGFDVKRVNLSFSGNVNGPDTTYELELEHEVDGTLLADTAQLAPAAAAAYARLGYRDVAAPTPGTPVRLREAWAAHRMGAWTLRAGQFRSSYLRENMLAFFDHQPVEQSLVAEIFKVDIVRGVEVQYAADLWRVTASYHDGAQQKSPATAPGVEFAGTLRAEAILLGTWEQQTDFSSPPDGEVGLMVGGGVDYARGELGTPAPEQDQIGWTVDASLELAGPNVFAAVIGRRIDDDGGFTANQLGIVVQGGWDCGTWQPFVRYEWADLDTTGLSDVSILTGGVRWDLEGHLRWTTDVMYGFDPVPVGSSLVGVGADRGERGQIVLRTQLGLWF